MAGPTQLDLFARPPLARAPAPVPPRASARPPPPVGEHVTGPELRRRGWTAAAISRFLGQPDEVVQAQRGGWSYTVHHFAAGRVRLAEGSPAFGDWLRQRDARREAARRGEARVLAEALERVSAPPWIHPERLRQLAVEHYNRRLLAQMDRTQEWDKRPAALDSEPAFLERISVNYLRHAGTPYDAVLRRLERMGERGRALVPAVKRRVLEAIAAVFPELAEECERQAARIGYFSGG